MKSKAIARIVPINDDGDGRLPFYARTVRETIGGFEGVEIDGSGYACRESWWKIEMLPAEWNGEGSPTVGLVCEVRTSNTHEIFELCEIVYSGEHGVSFVYLGSGVIDCVTKSLAGKYFRPIRSARDNAVAVIQEYMPNGGRDYDESVGIYDAIAAGKIPGIKLED